MFVSNDPAQLTEGRELVSAEGASLQDVITNLDTHYSGIAATPRRRGTSALHACVSERRRRPTPRRPDTAVAVGDSVTILPAVTDGFLV